MQLSDFTASIQPQPFAWHAMQAGFTGRGQGALTDSNRRDAGQLLVPVFQSPLPTPYDPFDDRHKTLFYKLASLEPTESAIIDFAHRYGTLRENPQTSLLFWKDEIAQIADAIALWEAIKSQDSKSLRPWVHWPKSNEVSLLCEWQAFHDARKSDFLGTPPQPHGYRRNDPAPAKELLRRIISRQMQPASKESALTLPGDTIPTANVRIQSDALHVLAFKVAVRDLLVALWIQFAIAIAGDKQYRECEFCGTRFELDDGRSDKRFCDLSCQMKAYRRRQKEARRLHADGGKTPGQIAKLLDSDTQTVRCWLSKEKK